MDAAAEAAGGLSMSDKQIVECDIGVSDEMLDRMIRCVDYGFAAQNGITMAKLLALYEGGNLLRQEEKHD